MSHTKLKYDCEPNQLLCDHCGVMEPVRGYPMLLSAFVKMVRNFNRAHKSCRLREK